MKGRPLEALYGGFREERGMVGRKALGSPSVGPHREQRISSLMSKCSQTPNVMGKRFQRGRKDPGWAAPSPQSL